MDEIIIIGPIPLMLCCLFGIIWWYRRCRPDIHVYRNDWVNRVLLIVRVILGIAGLLINQLFVWATDANLPLYTITVVVIVYCISLWRSLYLNDMAIKIELGFITGWTILELSILGNIVEWEANFEIRGLIMYLVFIMVFIISIALFYKFNRVHGMDVLYAAVVPLIMMIVAMGLLILVKITTPPPDPIVWMRPPTVILFP